MDSVSKEPTYSVEEFLKLNDTDEILSRKASEFSKVSFYHFTSADSVRSIIVNNKGKRKNYIFVSSIEKMNDIDELGFHKAEKSKLHIFCTCNTKHDKIPMWYLYSGITGDGFGIGFPASAMQRFIKGISFVYPVIDGKPCIDKPLFKEKGDFEVFCGWVCYLMDGNNRFYYKNCAYTVVPLNETDIGKGYFIKRYPWEYEKEFRVIIKTRDDYDRIAIELKPEIIKHLRIVSAPERKVDKKLTEALISSGIKPEKIRQSDLRIRMNLYSAKDILKHMDSIFSDNEDFEALRKYVAKRSEGGNLK